MPNKIQLIDEFTDASDYYLKKLDYYLKTSKLDSILNGTCKLPGSPSF